MPVLRAVLETNAGRAAELLRRLRAEIPSLAGARIAVLGLAFKPDTDDVRESPAIPVVEGLIAEGAEVRVHDPAALGALPRLFGDRALPAETLEDAVRDADAVVIVTRWSEYERLPELLAGIERPPLVVDGRRMLPRTSVPRYEGIGL
jgi:UDPglucose 6-dehydrogenase/GDP-mannose 6-dehydrogenase